MYKIEDIIEALLYCAGSREIKTKIVKTCYLLESDYFNETGKRLTPIEYKYWKYGPYSKAIVDAAERNKNIKYDSKISIKGDKYDLYELKISIDLISKFDPFTLTFIEKWGQIMKESALDQLKKLAYEDKNFKGIKKGEIINFTSDFIQRKNLFKKRLKEKYKSLTLTDKDLRNINKDINQDLIAHSSILPKMKNASNL